MESFRDWRYSNEDDGHVVSLSAHSNIVHQAVFRRRTQNGCQHAYAAIADSSASRSRTCSLPRSFAPAYRRSSLVVPLTCR